MANNKSLPALKLDRWSAAIWLKTFRFIVLIPFLWCASSVNAQTLATPEISEHIPDAQLVGEGMFTYYFWDVYLGQLYAPGGEYRGEPPFALKLTYQRNLKGAKIAQRSIDEMQKQQRLPKEIAANWLSLMEETFPDVKEGDSITGVASEDATTVFYFNGERLKRINDTEFTSRFFDIWLSSKTSEPEFKAKLVGKPKAN